MDQLQTRLDALEQQVQTLNRQTHTVKRQFHWWRGLACGLAVVGLLGWGLPLGLAREDAPDKDKDQKGLAQRVAALEELLQHFSREKNEIFITGANLHIVNGLGRTDCGTEEDPIPDCPNGLGNLIVGYNELRNESDFPDFPNVRTGSHNVVVGQRLNFSRFGGLVVGDFNAISGDFSTVIAGTSNTASGLLSFVSGGQVNTASGPRAAIYGGEFNTASGDRAVVSGGAFNTASGLASAVYGGVSNGVRGEGAAIYGGENNAADGRTAVYGGIENMADGGSWAAVYGGAFNTASGIANSSVYGGQNNTASGRSAVVCGGTGNTAVGDLSAVSGGRDIIQATEFGWSAGSEGDEIVVGNFRSP
jgi:hypothetical protein